MDEPVIAGSEKHAPPQKPPLSVGRIASEILAGMGVGFATGLLGGLGFLMMPYDKGYCPGFFGSFDDPFACSIDGTGVETVVL